MEPSTRAVIRLSAFRNNLVAVRRCIGPDVKIMAVLKSNAYGHGVRPLADEAVRWGIDALAVARIGEGLELRKDGIECPVLVCELVPHSLVAQALQHDLELTVSTIEGAAAIDASASKEGRKARVHVKVDTGMGRLGFPRALAASSIETIARMPSVELAGVYSHFATSEDTDQTFAQGQLKEFQSVLEELRQRGIEVPLKHMANSGAILTLPESHLDMVRPGIMLFGFTPSRWLEAKAELQPVMSLMSKVSLIKTFESGTSISYGRRYYTKEKTCIATVPIGYGDGYSRMLTNKAEVLIGGKRYPCVGTVCMDHLMVDLGLHHPVSTGDDVVLIGKEGSESITSWDIAEKLGTIPYEVTCLITPRVFRVVAE